MSTVKERVREVVDTQPEDASYEEIMRELAFARMVERGMEDARSERMIDNDEMQRQIKLWRG